MGRQGVIVATSAISGIKARPAKGSSLARWWPLALIALLVLALRLPTFGNPLLDLDEQFYLLVGDRLLHGQLPYVDLWDRKPVGLFVLYAAIRLLGGAGVVQYQLVATGFVIVTAWLIRAMVRRHGGEGAAILGAVGYVLALNILHGAGGQTAVFYNAFTAFAAWCAFRANDATSSRAVLRLALAAMVALGLAIQIKYTVVAEGAFLGCWFLYRLVVTGARRGHIVAMGTAMLAVALLPTALALAWYAAIGHLADFAFANFVSIFHRHAFPVAFRHRQVAEVAACGGGLLAAALIGLVRLRQAMPIAARADWALLVGWLASALCGFAMLGDVFSCYALPVALPAALASAWALRGGRWGFVAGCLMLGWPLLFTPASYFVARQSAGATDRMVGALAPYVSGHCLYVYDGPSILYLRTGACAPTRFLFPHHLVNAAEADALGVDPLAEERRILASRPGAIVTASRAVDPVVAAGPRALVQAALARDYVLVDRVPTIDRTFLIWARRDLRTERAQAHP